MRICDDKKMESRELPHQTTEPTDESSETLFHIRRHRSFFPCFDRKSSASPSVGSLWWQKIRTAEIESSGSLWARGVSALTKFREWSEFVAGPRLKTFIRRFNRNRSGNDKHVNIQYDALSYAMNFDEGPGQSRQSNEEDGYYYASRNFSSRYAKGSMDMGKDGPAFV